MTISKWEDYFLTAKGYFLSKKLMHHTQYYTPNQIEAFQFRAVYKLLNEVCRYIPFYQKLFWDYDFDPSRFDNLDQLKILPVLSKDTLLNSPHEFISANYAKKGLDLSTSGSTGRPLKTFASKNQWIVEQASVWRQWDWAGYRFRDKIAIIRSYAPKNYEPIFKLNKLKNWLYISPYHLSEENVLEILKKLKIWKPKFLRGYPSSLYVFAKIAKSYNIKIESLKGAFTASEVLTDVYRNEIEEAFNIKVFDHYGQAEITTMLHECEEHDGLHIIQDYAYTEFVDTSSDGEKKLIATNLFNYAMPLIRYDTGDRVIINKNKCSCGRTFPKVKRIIGRSDTLLIHKEGYYLPSINFYTFFAKLKNVSKFQIIQYSHNDIEIKIQVINKNNIGNLKYHIESEINGRFGTKVVLKFTDQFIMSEGGKCNPIIQKIKL